MVRRRRRVRTSSMGTDYQPRWEGRSVAKLRALLIFPHRRQTYRGGRHGLLETSQSRTSSAYPGRVTSTSQVPHATQQGTWGISLAALPAFIATPGRWVLLARRVQLARSARGSIVRLRAVPAAPGDSAITRTLPRSPSPSALTCS